MFGEVHFMLVLNKNTVLLTSSYGRVSYIDALKYNGQQEAKKKSFLNGKIIPTKTMFLFLRKFLEKTLTAKLVHLLKASFPE